ncbi:HU family DNA-binding protein [Leadbettera azotonutricia]|uniref:Integration host factor, beta subunit n=1 Tax=Leadbettera azotonutricia (strain ATCC BAA-888 / DSM 13862 / ZAS-9) TaxID=545695 RepID=F5YF71_LEAAZ|nr:HU family DNA-binding protein [Leadbettera azotonutricia]AEF81386.1 integration host factor, beta subunit [Leadbettera azotonutricia ZAS-9]
MAKFTREKLIAILRSDLPGIAPLDTHHARELAARIVAGMAAALASGDSVELRGLGGLEVKTHPERRARNPRTGEPVIVPPRQYVVFKAGRELKTAMNSKEVDDHGT